MDKRKTIGRSVIQFITCIFLLVTLTFHNASAEPMEPSPSKDDVNKLIAGINKSKPDEKLVNELLIIARHYLYDDDKEAKIYIDRVLLLSKKLSYNEGLIKSMCLQAAFLKNISKDTAAANEVVDSAILLSRNLKLPELEAYAYYTKGLWFKWLNLGSMSKVSEEYGSKARDLYKSTGNRINQAYMIKCLADIHIGQKNYGQALKELFEALELYRSAGHPFLHHTYFLIATVYNTMGNYEEKLKYGLLAIKSAEQAKDTADIALFYFEVGQVFIILKQPEEAFKYYSFVLEKENKGESSFFLQRASAAAICKVLIQKGKPAEAIQLYKKIMVENPVKQGSLKYAADELYLGDLYFLLKQYDKAERLFLHMLEYTEEDYTGNFNLKAFLKLGNFYIAQAKFAKATEYINKAMLEKSLRKRVDIINLNLQQFKVDSASANYLSAIKHYQTYKALNDSTFNEIKSSQIASINIQYQTEKKQQEIGTLTAENKEKQVILEKRIFERNVFTAGAIMLLLLLLLSVNRYRIKQRANKQLQEQQEIINKKNEILNCLLKEKEEILQSKDKLIVEKEWLIKEVHHRVKNNLQMISTLLYSQAAYLRDDAAIAAINESQQRIHAISLIHQKLYQSDSLQLVNMKSYVHELVDYLKESFDSAQEIEFNVEVDSFELRLINAIPLGLILNEAITNSLKYAFGKDERKIISIQLQRHEDLRVLLQIKDNGRGMPVDFNPLKSDSLGINLMNGLSNQLNADFSIKNENGTVILLEFEEKNELMGDSLAEHVV